MTRRNLVKANNRTDCGEEDPVPSGNGILLLGAADNDISKNLVLDNRGEGVEGLGGGIVLVTGGEPGGPQFEPSGTRVRRTSPSATSRSISPGTAPATTSPSGATAAAPPSQEACATDRTSLARPLS